MTDLVYCWPALANRTHYKHVAAMALTATQELIRDGGNSGIADFALDRDLIGWHLKALAVVLVLCRSL